MKLQLRNNNPPIFTDIAQVKPVPTKKKITVIIPTMWKYYNFVYFLQYLALNDNIAEIILVDNNPTEKPDKASEVINQYPIIQYHTFHFNMGVNQAWNFGANNATGEILCFCNDDMMFDAISLFSKILDFYNLKGNNSTVGAIGYCPGETKFNQPPVTDGSINIKAWEGEHIFGFGCLFFIEKSKWRPIPESLKIYFGDNFVLDNQSVIGNENYIITNMFNNGTFGVTSSIVVPPEVFVEESKHYEEICHNVFRMVPHLDLKQEYLDVCTSGHLPATFTNLPKLFELANECDSVCVISLLEEEIILPFLISNSKTISVYMDKFEDKVVNLYCGNAKRNGKIINYNLKEDGLFDTVIDETDILFIDSAPVYTNVKNVLKLNKDKVKKYIAIHNTISSREVYQGVNEFLIENPSWKLKYSVTNGQGLIVLARENVQVQQVHQAEPTTLKRILIGIPTDRNIYPETFKSIYDLIVPAGYKVEFQWFYGYMVDQVRNLMADWGKHFDYLFFVDSDITFPPDTLVKLLAHNVDIVGGIYTQRIEGIIRLEAYIGKRNLTVDEIKNHDKLIEVDSLGFGCCLVNSNVFRAMEYPHFVYQSALDHNNTVSEDTYFCWKAKQKNFKSYIDPTIKCGHIGKKVFNIL